MGCEREEKVLAILDEELESVLLEPEVESLYVSDLLARHPCLICTEPCERKLSSFYLQPVAIETAEDCLAMAVAKLVSEDYFSLVGVRVRELDVGRYVAEIPPRFRVRREYLGILLRKDEWLPTAERVAEFEEDLAGAWEFLRKHGVSMVRFLFTFLWDAVEDLSPFIPVAPRYDWEEPVAVFNSGFTLDMLDRRFKRFRMRFWYPFTHQVARLVVAIVENPDLHPITVAVMLEDKIRDEFFASVSKSLDEFLGSMPIVKSWRVAKRPYSVKIGSRTLGRRGEWMVVIGISMEKVNLGDLSEIYPSIVEGVINSLQSAIRETAERVAPIVREVSFITPLGE